VQACPTLIPPEEQQHYEGEPGEVFAEETNESSVVSATEEPVEYEAEDGGGGGEMMLDSVVEISSNITSNTIWTANNTYYIIADINVRALLVIEPGTIIRFASGATMHVNNGGTLISAGTPDNPIVYTSDSAEPGYSDYYCAILIEETASAATKISYNYIEYAYYGIAILNNCLDNSIESNYLYNNVVGIFEFGSKFTDIQNNLIYAADWKAISIHMQDSCDRPVLIQNNTCDYQEDGILVYGYGDTNYWGYVVLQNNIVSRSTFYGIHLSGHIHPTVTNNGYYGNTDNVYWDSEIGDYNEVNPVIETESPFVTGTGTLPFYYLRQDCNFINTGYEYIEQTRLIGKTTAVSGFPDSNLTDLGFHYPNWNFSNAGDGNGLTMDLFNDSIINFKDLAILAAGWQTTYDINDLSTLAAEWLKNDNPPITVTVSGDPNNLSGEVSIGISGYGTTTEHAFVLVDGEYVDKLEYFDSNTPILIDTDNSRNGSHSIKVVTTEVTGLVIVSDTLEVDFNNAFHSIIASNYFHPTTDYTILGFHNGSGSFEVKLTDYNGQILWSNSYNGSNLSSTIPGAAFGNEKFCELTISETDSGMMTTTGSSGVIKKDLTKKFKREDCPSGLRMVIILPNKDVFKRRIPAILECARACDRRNVSWVPLYHHDVNEDNLRFLYNLSSVKYVYWCGHANSHVGRNERLGIEGVQRTHTICWRYEPSWWHFNWQEIGVFSWTRQTRNFPPLPDDWDNRGFDLWTLPMHDQWNKKIVFVDGCLSARYSDMAEAYGVFSLQGYGSLDQIYIGWRSEAVTAHPGTIWSWIEFCTDGVKLFWERMGDGTNVQSALLSTYVDGGTEMRETF